MGKDQAVAGSSTLFERSDFDFSASQGRQGCGDSEGGQANAAESPYYRLHCECAKEVNVGRSGEPLGMVVSRLFFAGFIMSFIYPLQDPRSDESENIILTEYLASMPIDGELGE